MPRPHPPPPPPAWQVPSRAVGLLPGHRRAARAGRALALGFLALLLGSAALLLAASILAATGVLAFLVGLTLALLPVAPVVGAYLWADRLEPEPPPLLAFLFAWGAVVAALAASLINTVTLQILGSSRGAGAFVSTAVVVAPLVEEAAKGAGILAVVLLRRQEFDGVLDGIVCAGLVGVGFAFTENILYFGRAFLAGAGEAGLEGGILAAGATFVLRGVLSPFAHPLFTGLTGIGLGIAAHARSALLRWSAPLLGYTGAVLLHSMWNLSAVNGPHGFLTNYALLMLPVFVVGIALVGLLRRRESRLLGRQLPSYVAAGWLPPYDVAMLVSLPARRQARAWAQAMLGGRGKRAMRDYQRAATELAFLRDRAQRLGADRAFGDRERVLLAALRSNGAWFALGPAGRPRRPGP